MTLQAIWEEILTDTGVLDQRPDFRFDPDFYLSVYSEIAASGMQADEHYRQYGAEEGRMPTLYRHVAATIPDLPALLRELTTDPRLRAALASDDEDADELAFELIALGGPHDFNLSDFSSAYYLRLNPDIEKGGLNPLLHYLQFGRGEGRRSLSDLRKNRHAGRRSFDPDRPTCLICVHEFSKSGAPIVGLEIVRVAAETHNVVVGALRDGPLLEAFRDHAVSVLISERPAEEFGFFADPALDHIAFAVLNSVECYLYTKLLVRREIPFASYIHEYTEYTVPSYKSIFMALYSDLLVFSSGPVRDSWQQIFDDLDFDVARDSIIVPQAPLIPGGVAADEFAAARAHLSRLIGRDCTGKRIVLGAGHAQWRKGTDLFVLAAQECRKRDPDTLFVWVGDGVNHEDVHFGVWLDKHMREACANTAEGNLHFLPAGAYYLDLCRAADAMFLSSRLDPLPNVVFDAVRLGCRVVRFAGASGFDDPHYRDCDALVAVPYGDLAAVCDALRGLPPKRADDDPVAAPEPPETLFGVISGALSDRLARQRHFVAGAGEYDVPVLFTHDEADRPGRVFEREKMWTYGRRLVWPSLAAARAEIAASDNWIYRRLRLERYAMLDPGAAVPDFSVHIHAYYTDGLAEDLDRYAVYTRARRIVVTTTSEDRADTIERIFADAGLPAEIVIGTNTGRDILPFLRLFGPGGPAEGDDGIWCHVHQKKSLTLSTDGDVWRAFLMTILFGEGDELSAAVGRIADPEVGLVSAFDPYMIDWNASRRLLPALAPKLPGPLPKHPLLFPVGNMFWTRAPVVRRMRTLFGEDYPWPNEPIPNDGSVYHLIERLWPAAAAMAGLGSVFLEKRDQKRN